LAELECPLFVSTKNYLNDLCGRPPAYKGLS
jgi:hypothetical protein